MACNCNRADCKAETNARGCCPFRSPYAAPTYSQASVPEYLAEHQAKMLRDRATREGQGMAWGPFDPN